MRSSFGSPTRGPRAWRTIRTHPAASSSPAAATSAARRSRPSGANASGNVLASSLRITSRGQGVDRPYETLRSWLSSSLASSSLRGERVVALIACELLGEVENCRRSEEHTSELQSLAYLVCRLLLEKKK